MSETTALMPMRQLIRLAAEGARGETLGDMAVDWPQVLALGTEQNVLSLVACALLHAPALSCPEALRTRLMERMRAESSVSLVRRQRIMCLLGEMRGAGLDVQLLKGYAVAECYAYPECRACVDADVLIPPRQEKDALRYLSGQGFVVSPRAATSQHAVCKHRKYGVIELHVALYAELVQDVWFRGAGLDELVQEPPKIVPAADGGFVTLGDTDQLIFLTLHMLKHFILGGLTLRMMLDVALFFAHHRDSIDAPRYWGILRQVHDENAVAGILWCMIRYGGFDAADFPGLPPENTSCCDALLDDLLRGGYMGVKEEHERYVSGMEYNRLVIRQHKSGLRYTLYMLWWKVKGAALHMFPSRAMLEETCPAARHAVLRPLLRVWQMVAYPARKVASGVLKREIRTATSETSDVVRRRIRLFQSLEMLPPAD